MTASRCDVAVVGGGSAGVAAALASARAGAHTVLVERSDRLGGNAAHALVHTICGLYYEARADAPEAAQLGLARELAAQLGGAPERAGRVWYLPLVPAAYSALLAERCAGVAGLETRLHCELIGAALAPGGSGDSALVLRARHGQEELRAAVVVDASGDAVACAAGNAAWEIAPSAELQCASYIFRLAGVAAGALAGFTRVQLSAAIAGATRSGALPAGAESVVMRCCGAPGDVYVTLNLPRPEAWDPLDREAVEEQREGAQASAEAIARFLRETRAGFEVSRLAEHARALGVRETRRGLGREQVSASDVLGGRRRDDEVALSTWPIELWREHRRASFEYPAGACSVPLGALVSRSHPRLALAGRCLSATHEALGALRVIGTALATGEAAGAAAALAASAGVGLREIAAERVRAETRPR